MNKDKCGLSAPIKSGVINTLQFSFAVAVWCLLLSFGTAAKAQTTDGVGATTAGTSGVAQVTSPTVDATNTPVKQIQDGLDKIKAEIVTAVKQMQDANASTPAKQVQKVTELARQLRALGSNDLSDTSEIVKNADDLIAKMKAQLSHARASSSDPNIGARQIYLAVATRLEPELSKLIDARASVNQVRSELLRKADSLDQSAAAIGFAEDAAQSVLAANAFRDVLTDVVKFTTQIENMIDSVAPIPAT